MSELKYILIHPDWVEMMLTKDTAEKQVAFIVAIFEYALEGKVPPAPRDLENPRGVDYAARDGYLAAKSNIDFILSKVRAGSKGGSAGRGESKARKGNQNARKYPKPEPENTSETEAEQKQNASKTQANHKQNASLDININKNINIREMSPKGDINARDENSPSDDVLASCSDPILPTRMEMELYAHHVSVPKEYIDTFLDRMKELGWEYVNAAGRVVRLHRRNFKSLLRTFYETDQRKQQSIKNQIKTNQPQGVVHQQDGYDLSDFTSKAKEQDYDLSDFSRK